MNHPPFSSNNPRSTMDFMSYNGAHELASRITRAWALAGHKVPCEVIRATEFELPVYVVRTPALINGLP